MGLTAVFGMGTGVTPPVWSPENRPRGGQAAGPLWLVTLTNQSRGTSSNEQQSNPFRDRFGEPTLIGVFPFGGEPIGVVKLLGC